MKLSFGVILFFCTYVFTAPKSHGQDPSLKAFETAVDYLCNNKHLLADKWREIASWSKSNYNEVLENGLNFKVADTFFIRSITYFSDSLAFYRDGIPGLGPFPLDKGLPSEYAAFEPYKDPDAEKIIKDRKVNTDTDFVIGFSKPFKDFVVCELWYKYYGQRYKNRFGESLRILFLFNTDGSIKKVYYKQVFR